MNFFSKILCLTVIITASPVLALAAVSHPFTVNLSEIVNVDTTGGVPRIAVDVGGVTRYATYTAGTGTSALTFTYDAIIGDVDLDGVTLSSPIELNGGMIRDTVGNNATLTFTPPNTTGVRVNYPSLGMDFVADADGRYTLNGTVYNDLPSFLTATGGTFTRGSIGTYYNSSGVLQTASTNTPRFDYDPVTLQPKGILIEESRTNLLLMGSNFIDAGWSKNNTLVNANAAVAPDGTMTAQKIIENNLNNSHSVSRGTAVTSGITYTYSVYVKASDRSFTEIRYLNGTNTQQFSLIVNLSNGTYITSGVPAGTGIFTNYVGNGWYRCGFTMVSNDATFRTLIHVRQDQSNQTYLGDNTSGIYVWGAQLEQRSFPTSYIPTTAVAVTRVADALTIPTAPWYSQNEGTVALGAIRGEGAGLAYEIAGPNRAVSDVLGFYPYTAHRYWSAGFVDQGLISQTISMSSNYKTAFAYKQNDFAAALNGTFSGTDIVGTVSGGMSVFNLGSGTGGGGQQINSPIARFRYYPVRVSNAQLQLLTQ